MKHVSAWEDDHHRCASDILSKRERAASAISLNVSNCGFVLPFSSVIDIFASRLRSGVQIHSDAPMACHFLKELRNGHVVVEVELMMVLRFLFCGRLLGHAAFVVESAHHGR